MILNLFTKKPGTHRGYYRDLIDTHSHPSRLNRVVRAGGAGGSEKDDGALPAVALMLAHDDKEGVEPEVAIVFEGAVQVPAGSVIRVSVGALGDGEDTKRRMAQAMIDAIRTHLLEEGLLD